jgi:WD40 repeat protein
MSTTSGSRDYGHFDELAEEFAERYRRGERPELQEYIERLPEMADEIREMFPALVEVEQVEADARDDALQQQQRAIPYLGQIGDYRILREVGRGGMGVVYEAEQISLGRRVALKVLPGQASGNRVVQERFRREARAAARMHHTNIVPVFEVGHDGDVRFYAMQFIDGQGLDAVITELIRLLDRARSESRIKAVAEGRSPWRRGQDSRRGIATPTLSDGVEVSLVLRSILTGRFDPAGRGPDPLKAPPSIRAGDPAEGRAAPTGTGTERPMAGSDLALTRTEVGSATSGDAIGRQPAQPPEPDSSMSPAPSSTSAILPGGTQLSSVESGRRAFFRSLAQLGRQVAGGLAYAHARGIVHRDIKPSNLLLDTEGVVWIADFGLAKGDDEGLTQSGDILGTIRYMAPERFRGEGDARADVYALGLTLYELLTLRPGFDSSDRLKLIEQIKAEEPPRPRSVDGRIPRDLETIVLKAIEKDPRARYQSAEAMGDDLGRFLADEPIRARQVRAAERYWRWARRNPVIAVLGGVVTALLVAMTVGSTIAATYFQGLAGRESRANQQSQEAQRIAVVSRNVAEAAQEQALLERDKSRRLSAGLAMDKGIALAQEGYADRGLLWMLEALRTAPDDAEGFRKVVRWSLGAWLGQVHRTLRIIETGGPCDDVAFSPDGRSFATGFIPRDPSLATPIESWDTASGRKLSSWPGAFAPFAFRPDGKVLVALDDRRRVVAIDRVTRRVLWTTPPLPGDFGETIDFSPDASTVFATSSGGENRWWLSRLDASTGRPLGEAIPSIGFVAAAPDGRTVAARRVEGGKAYIDLIDLPSGRGTASWPASPNLFFLSAFRPDARSLFLSQAKGGILNQNSFFGRIWDLGAGRPTSPPMTSTTMAGYPPSADRLVTLTQSVWVVRDAGSGRVRGSGLNAGAEAFLASHPDGRTMISASPDGVVHLWRISADAEPVFAEEADAQPSMSGIESDGRMGDGSLFRIDSWTDGRIAVASAVGAGARELIRLSDPTTGRPLGRPAAHYPGWKIRSLALSPDRRCFATGSHPDGRVAGEVRVWDASTGRLRFPPMPHTNYVGALAFQPDGKVLAAGDFNGLVRLWDGATGREIGRPLPQGEIVLSLAYSPDGATLAVGLSLERTGKPGVRLWDTRTRQPIGELLPCTYAVSRIEFRPDGRILLAESGHLLSRTIRLWDVPRGRAIGEPMIDEGSGGFRPDGRAFLTVASDGTVKLRDAATGAVLVSLLTAPSRATCAAFRDDGGLVVAGFADGTVRLCDPATSQPVGPPRSMRHPVQDVAFTPDGRTIAAIDDFGESRTWPVPEPLPDESIADLTLRIEARTGLRMETGLAISRLDTAAWRDRLGRLDQAAVQPDDDPAWH